MRVLTIGLDGATFDLVKPWATQGELPTFKMLMENGVHCDLTSTIPPVSSPAWPSFMTGKNPGNHGVFDFVGKSDSYSRKIVNARDLQSKTLWRLLSEEGKTNIVLAVPVTYPPREDQGMYNNRHVDPAECLLYLSTRSLQRTQENGLQTEQHIKRNEQILAKKTA